MFFENLNRVSRKVSFRIWLWYAATFVLIAVLLFFVFDRLLTSALTQKDRQNTQNKLAQLASLYKESGLAALHRELENDKAIESESAFLVRLAGPKNETRVLHNADLFEEFDPARLTNATAGPDGWIYLSERTGEDEFEWLEGTEKLEMLSTRFSDGMTLQVGTTSEHREDVRESFRFLFAAIAVPLFLFGGTVLSVRSLRPLRTMIATVEAIRNGRMESRVPLRQTGDELDQLARLFNEMLERIQRLIEGMKNALDNVAHDLRTPITRLRAAAETALQSQPNQEMYREALADCLEESDKMLHLLNMLMDISEAEAGSMKLHLQQVEVSELIEDSVDLYRYSAEEKGIELDVKCTDKPVVLADINRMRQVLANLLDNAIKYTASPGRVELEAFRLRDNAVIIVRDSGIGIDQEELPRIWERLYRGSNARSYKGIGLGLSLVRAVVQAHGGRVEVDSVQGNGSTFRLYLPAC